MIDPLFWLALSIVLVAASLTAVVVAAIPALQELAHAARSAEKLFDILSKELPPTLQAIRNTSLEITDLSDDVGDSVKSAGKVIRQVDESLDTAKKQAQDIQISSRSLLVGVKTAWQTFTRPKKTQLTTQTLPINEQPELKFPQQDVLDSEAFRKDRHEEYKETEE